MLPKGLQLSSYVWNHSTLNILVITAENESWWNPAVLNCTLRAVGQWNEAVNTFAANNSDFSYLSNLRFEPKVSRQWTAGYDVYVNYTQFPLSSSSDEVGLTQIYANNLNVITNCTVNLATHTAHGSTLSVIDMQNIALHEFGHTLGLGHSNYTGDLMNALYGIGSASEKISTLDVYGVATMFAWMINSSFYPISAWLKVNSVTLPASIAYQGLPVSAQNMAPQSLADNPVVQVFILMYELLLHPEIAAIVAFAIAVFMVVAIFIRRKPRA